MFARIKHPVRYWGFLLLKFTISAVLCLLESFFPRFLAYIDFPRFGVLQFL